MKITWPVLALVALTLLLLGSNAMMLSAWKSFRERGETPETKALREERINLAAERARIQSKVADLNRLLERFERVGASREQPDDDSGKESPENPDGSAAPSPESPRSLEKPDPMALEILPAEEVKRLVQIRRRMPIELSGNLLLNGDVDLVLVDPLWNPGRRVLDERERSELKRCLDDYRYFARVASSERFRHWVEPEIPRLREAGAYVEYGETEAPPAIRGVRVSHAEPSDRPGYLRLYYFFEEDYPDLYHHEQVSKERELETFVKVYLLINGEI